jgi:integrase
MSGSTRTKARRGQGEDSIYQDGDRWRGAVSLGFGPDGKRLRKKVSGETRDEVVRKLRKLREQLDAGLPPADDRLSVSDFLDRWLTVNLPGSVGPSTEDNYGDTVRLHLRPGLGRKKLTKLTVRECDQLWQAKRKDGYSSNSIRIMRTVLRKALGQAEREGLVPRNVAALSAPPRVSAKEGRTLTLDQAHSLLAALHGERREAVVTIMLAYGLRRGEALGLHWDRLNWDEGTILVTHSVKRIKSHDNRPGARRTKLVVSELKTRLAGSRAGLPERGRHADGPGQLLAPLLRAVQAGRSRSLASARAAPLRGVVDARPGHRAACGLRGTRAYLDRHYERRLWSPAGGRPAIGGGADVTGAVRCLREPEWLPKSRWLPAWLPRRSVSRIRA